MKQLTFFQIIAKRIFNRQVQITSFFSLLLVMTTATSNAQKLQTVPYVDLNKYAGKWYEIASYPQRFQKGCHCTTAEYTLSDKGYVIVENRCKRDSVNGKQSYIKGKAFVEKNSGNAKLKVQFFWPFKGGSGFIIRFQSCNVPFV